MPVYVYRCHDCKKTFEKRHGMFFEQKRCVHCHSEDIFKVPSVEYTSNQPSTGPKKPGKIVDEYIEDVKKEIKAEKKALKNEEM
jgi:putative FmdB family regulatory protein